MDDISLLVAETFRHHREHFTGSVEEIAPTELSPIVPSEEGESELPETPGVLYHIQKTTSIFVVRTFASANIREDYRKIVLSPEDYPSLRLIEDDRNIASERLRFFMAESLEAAQIIHDHLGNRRFPVHEEHMCNLSDPGFSWWLSGRENGFQISFNLSSHESDRTVKLGPIGDQQLAARTFLGLGNVLQESGLTFSIQNETNRIQFTEGESILMEAFQDMFEYGVVGEDLTGLFRLLARKQQDTTTLETIWLYLQELAGMRRFWIQVQYDLSAASA